MIKAFVGNLFDFIDCEELDTIQNAANGIGPLGRGIAGAIREQGGVEIQTDAFRVCKELDPQPGQAYKTISGKLENQGIMCIIHAVTMKQPGGFTSYEIVKNAFEAALKLAYDEGTLRIGCTALGTGGYSVKLDPRKVAQIMYEIAKGFTDMMDIIFVDFNKEFINEIDESIKKEKETKEN